MRLFCLQCNGKRDVKNPGERLINSEELWTCTVCEGTVRLPILRDKLINMPFETACLEKFKVGRAEHGPVFLNNPVEEIDMELVDAVNYALEAIKQGYDKARMEIIVSKLKEVDSLVRELYVAS